MKCLVTGASGFIGARLCAALRARGDVVRALLHGDAAGPWDERVVGDIQRPLPADTAAGVDVVFHLAARTHAVSDSPGDAGLYRAVNEEGTRHVLDAAASSGAGRFVLFSSVKAIGEGGDRTLDDDSAPNPTTAYGVTKRGAERQVLEGGLVPEPIVLRPALVYGPGTKGNLHAMLQAIDRGRFPSPPDVGNRRSMVHVDDVVAAALLAASHPDAVGRAFIVTDGIAYSTRDIYSIMSRALGRGTARPMPAAAFRLLARVGDTIGRVRGRRWRFDSIALEKLFGSAHFEGSAIVRDLGFRPRWDLEAAMPGIVAEYRQ